MRQRMRWWRRAAMATWSWAAAGSPSLAELDILQLVLIHPEIVAQFVDDRPPDLLANFGLTGADCFNVLLVEHDVIRPCCQVKDALPGPGHSVKQTQEQPSWSSRMGR